MVRAVVIFSPAECAGSPFGWYHHMVGKRGCSSWYFLGSTLIKSIRSFVPFGVATRPEAHDMGPLSLPGYREGPVQPPSVPGTELRVWSSPATRPLRRRASRRRSTGRERGLRGTAWVLKVTHRYIGSKQRKEVRGWAHIVSIYESFQELGPPFRWYGCPSSGAPPDRESIHENGGHPAAFLRVHRISRSGLPPDSVPSFLTSRNATSRDGPVSHPPRRLTSIPGRSGDHGPGPGEGTSIHPFASARCSSGARHSPDHPGPPRAP